MMARLAFWGLIVMVAAAPLPLGSNRPGPWSALAVLTGVLLILWALGGLRAAERAHMPWSRHWPVTVVFLAVLGWLYLQAAPWMPEAWHHPIWQQTETALGEPLTGAISMSPEQTKTALMRLATYGGVFWLAMQFGRSRERAAAALWSVAIAGTAYALYGVITELAGNQTILWYTKWAYLDSLTGSFVNRNSFASYAGLALLAAASLLQQRLRKSPLSFQDGIGEALNRFAKVGGLLFFCILILGSALLLSHSRGGLFALVAGIVVLIASELVRYRESGGGRRFAMSAALAGVVLLATGGGVTLQRIAYPTDLEDTRVAIARQTIAGIEQRPWTGTGYGTFEAAFNYWGAAGDIGIGRVDKAHDTYLEFAAEAGLPATLAVLGILAWIAVACARGILRRRRDAAYAEVALACMVQLGLHSTFDFSLQIPAVTLAFCLLIGTGYAQAWRQSEMAGSEGDRELALKVTS